MACCDSRRLQSVWRSRFPPSSFSIFRSSLPLWRFGPVGLVHSLPSSFPLFSSFSSFFFLFFSFFLRSSCVRHRPVSSVYPSAFAPYIQTLPGFTEFLLMVAGRYGGSLGPYSKMSRFFLWHLRETAVWVVFRLGLSQTGACYRVFLPGFQPLGRTASTYFYSVPLGRYLVSTRTVDYRVFFVVVVVVWFFFRRCLSKFINQLRAGRGPFPCTRRPPVRFGTGFYWVSTDSAWWQLVFVRSLAVYPSARFSFPPELTGLFFFHYRVAPPPLSGFYRIGKRTANRSRPVLVTELLPGFTDVSCPPFCPPRWFFFIRSVFFCVDRFRTSFAVVVDLFGEKKMEKIVGGHQLAVGSQDGAIFLAPTLRVARKEPMGILEIAASRSCVSTFYISTRTRQPWCAHKKKRPVLSFLGRNVGLHWHPGLPNSSEAPIGCR